MKWIVRVVVALLTFLVGVFASQLWSVGEHRIVKTRTLTVVRVAPPAIPPAAEEWRKIVVKDQFSFYIPPDLNDDGGYFSSDLATGVFRKANHKMSGLFYVDYYSHFNTEQDPTKGPNQYRSGIRSDVTIDGRRGTMVIEIPASDEVSCFHDAPEVKVYFPDIGGGRKLYMTFAAGLDGDGIAIAQRVIDSIEFPDALQSHVDWRVRN